MNPECKAEVSVNDVLALRFRIVSTSVSVTEYVEAISSTINSPSGSILAVFNEYESHSVKIYFDHEKHVKKLIANGFHIHGHHIRVDYVVPPGVKVIISNIDPLVKNVELEKILSPYGKIVSPIISPPISDDVRLCHIKYGVRYCYMTLRRPLPAEFEFLYGGHTYNINVKVGEEVNPVPFIKRDATDEHDTFSDDVPASPTTDVNVENNCPIFVSVKSATSGYNSDSDIGMAKLPIKRNPVKRKGRASKTLKIKRTEMTATAKAAKKIKEIAKHKNIRTRRANLLKKTGKTIAKVLNEQSQPETLLPLSTTSSSGTDASSSTSLEPPVDPLSERNLLNFIYEAKHNRALVDLAKKYLGNDCNDVIMLNLVDQVKKYEKEKCTSITLKWRLRRICKSLTDYINDNKS